MRDAARRIAHFDASRPWSWARWAGRALLAVGIFLPALLPLGSTFGRLALSVVALFGLAGALVIGALPTEDGRRFRFVEAGWSLMFLLHLAGHAWDYYDTVVHYDKVLHAVGGVVAGVAGLELTQRTSWFWPPGGATPFRVFFVVVGTVALAGVTVELIEYGSDTLLGARAQTHPVLGPLDDTMLDLMAEMVAGLATGLTAAWLAASSGTPDAHPGRRSRSMQEDS